MDDQEQNRKEKQPKQLRLNVPEVVELFKAIQKSPGSIFEIVRMNIQEEVGNYLSKLMRTELTHFLGREKYEHGSAMVITAMAAMSGNSA